MIITERRRKSPHKCETLDDAHSEIEFPAERSRSRFDDKGANSPRNSTGSDKFAQHFEVSSDKKTTFQSGPSKTRKKFVALRPVSDMTEASTASSLRIVSTVSIHPSTQKNEDPAKRSSEALLKENKKLKKMISKFTQEAESIQKTMRGWTMEFKKIDLSDDTQEIREEAFKTPRLDPLKTKQQQNNTIRTQDVQVSLVKLVSASPPSRIDCDKENLSQEESDQEDDDSSSSISSTSSSASSVSR